LVRLLRCHISQHFDTLSVLKVKMGKTDRLFVSYIWCSTRSITLSFLAIRRLHPSSPISPGNELEGCGLRAIESPADLLRSFLVSQIHAVVLTRD